MTDFVFGREDDGKRHGRFTATVSDHEGEAEITYTHRGPNRISADHTGSPDSLRGTGAAAALVAYMIEFARAEGFTIIPLCPYVRAQYLRHPDWQDVMTVGPGEDPTL